MDKFIVEMKDFAARNISSINQADYDKAKDDFSAWQDESNKHLVTDYYPDFNFGLRYVEKLYRSRVESFYIVLQKVSSIDEVKKRMMQTSSITSFGCGPGPEIAAYVSFMRTELHVGKRLDFTAVDKIDYWKYFLDVTKACDRNISIKFQNSMLSDNYLKRISPQGICIMSYPEAVNFGNIWDLMKEKFTLIIILDQSKTQLHANLALAGFKIIYFTFKGTKSYAYYLSDTRIVIPESQAGVVSEDNEGFWSYFSKCAIL